MLRRLTSLRKQLLAVFFVFIVLLVAVVFVAYFSYLATRKYTEVAQSLDVLEIETLKMIKNEQDFFFYDLSNEQFYSKNKSKYTQNHKQFYQTLQQRLEQLNQADLSSMTKGEDFKQSFATMQKELAQYDYLFKECVKIIHKKGFKNWGAEGEMRKYANELEKKHTPYIDKALLLNIRRYEKDYMLHKDERYVEKVEQLAQEMIDKLQQNPTLNNNTKQQIIDALFQYQRHFRALVYYDIRLGYDNKLGLRAKMRDKANYIGSLVHELHTQIELEVKIIRRTLTFLFYGTIITLVLLVIVLSYYTAAIITKPIHELIAGVEQMTSNNFQGATLLPETYQDETGILTQKFNQMLMAIQKQMQIIQQNNQDLSQHNDELTTLNESLKVAEQKQKRINDLNNKLLSIMSHDLRSPLNSIKGFLQILAEYGGSFSPEEIQRISQDTLYSLDNILNLLNNLLQWSLSHTGELEYNPETLHLQKQVQDIVVLYERIAQNKKIHITATIPPTLYVWADANMLAFVLRNLLSNAIKFSYPESVIYLIAFADRDKCYIKVKDAGVGIGAEAIQKIFNPSQYYTTQGTAKEKGTGFGLVICKEFIERNQGQMHIESEKGKGTTITFSLKHSPQA